MSLGAKNGLERRPSRFSTICAKNQVLKINIDKVTEIIDPKFPLPGASPCTNYYAKFSSTWYNTAVVQLYVQYSGVHHVESTSTKLVQHLYTSVHHGIQCTAVDLLQLCTPMCTPTVGSIRVFENSFFSHRLRLH